MLYWIYRHEISELGEAHRDDHELADASYGLYFIGQLTSSLTASEPSATVVYVYVPLPYAKYLGRVDKVDAVVIWTWALQSI